MDSLIRKCLHESLEKVIKRSKKNELAKKLKPSLNENEDVMKRFYGIKSNGHKPMVVEHVTIDRIMAKHGENGFISISANRSDLPQEENDANTQELISLIKSSGYSYLPTYGGYHNVETGEDSDYEPSFIVFNYNSNNEYQGGDFIELEEFGKELCGRFNQDCFMCKRPDAPAIYLDRDGNKVNSSESNQYWKNDPSKEFFSTFHTPEDDEKYGIGRRWTNDISFECVNPIPCTLAERMRRKGEVMLY